ncbi:MAG: phosphonate metabolism protein/1,5-bisphosphokinase (PRPP-forming) PhnN [Deltaproteobacteria bacterium]|nr:phosphonate metabolism protein/1,5-bisphosphokinase (PRPP-forming) PhnN [Candidatus Tharpella sp.]
MAESGQLFYLMGASGAGKDSLIRYAQQRLIRQKSIVFAQRYITRPNNTENDGNHYAIAPAEFEQLLKNDFFALHWNRHGFHYGIRREIDTWLREGKKVVINGSRQYYLTAQKIYPQLHAILVKADREILHKRLLTRQRDSPGNIEKRMQWAEDHFNFKSQNNLFSIIENNSSLKIAGEKFLDILQPNRTT